MMFLWILVCLVVFIGIMVIANWWRDERDEFGGMIKPASYSPPALPSTSRALHPSIDPYLAELREYLLQSPLPQGPGEMAERVYAHLNFWLNTHLTQDAPYDTSLEDDLLIEPTQRFVNMSRNDAAPPPGYLENLMKEDE